MEKYARLVFEEIIPDGATDKDIVEKIRNTIENYIKDGVNIDDIEISESPYMREGDV